MKKEHIYIPIIIILILVVLKTCNEPKPVNDNSGYFNQIDSLNKAYSLLSDSSIVLVQNYNNAKDKKDSVVVKIKTKYITIHDTVNNQVIQVLPKADVDTLINTYESVISKADSVITIKSKQIFNLEVQNDIKDTIITNQQAEIKRQKGKTLKVGIVTFFVGFFTGKSI